MKYRYAMFIDNTYLGEGTGTCRGRDSKIFPEQNTGFLCKFCGEIWARLVVPDPHATWFFLHQPCPRCGTGRLNINYWIGDDQDGPPRWLAREFLLAMEFGEYYWEWAHMSRQQYTSFRHDSLPEPVTAADFNNIPEF
jgi:hypothetical protein